LNKTSKEDFFNFSLKSQEFFLHRKKNVVNRRGILPSIYKKGINSQKPSFNFTPLRNIIDVNARTKLFKKY